MSDGVTVIETNPIKRFKHCLIGAPDVGLVGAIALSYIIREQQMAEVGYLESEAFPPVMVIHEGEPKSPLRLYAKGDMVVLAAEIPVEPSLMPQVSHSIIDWARGKGVELIISPSGIAVQNRLEIEVPAVYGVGSSPSVMELLKKANIQVLEEGFVAGLHATIMKECLRKNVPCAILLAQSHLQYPDPGAAASIIASISRIVGLVVDTKKLVEQEDEIRLKMRELMQRTQQQMRQTQKGREQEIPPMYV
jgi:uncharacterized protein